MTEKKTDRCLKQKEAAEIAGLSEATFERWRWSGDGPPYMKLGRAVRYLESDLRKWLEDRRRANTSNPLFSE